MSNDKPKETVGWEALKPVLEKEDIVLPKSKNPTSFYVFDTALLEEGPLHSKEQCMAFNSGKKDFIEGIVGPLRAMGHTISVVSVSPENMLEKTSKLKSGDLVFNLCDGTDDDGVVGSSLLRRLESLGVSYTGASLQFYEITTRKSLMKQYFEESNVPCTPFALLESDDDGSKVQPSTLIGQHSALKTWPLFVKVDDAYGSLGISDKSVVHDSKELVAQVASLRKAGFKRIVVEGYLDGQEYTCLVTSHRTFRPVWRVMKREGACCYGYEDSWMNYAEEFRVVEDEKLAASLMDIATRAFAAVRGTSYGRVDMRIQKKSNAAYVMEVNSNPGVGPDSSIWDVLRLNAAVDKCPRTLLQAEFLEQAVQHPNTIARKNSVSSPSLTSEVATSINTSNSRQLSPSPTLTSSPAQLPDNFHIDSTPLPLSKSESLVSSPSSSHSSCTSSEFAITLSPSLTLADSANVHSLISPSPSPSLEKSSSVFLQCFSSSSSVSSPSNTVPLTLLDQLQRTSLA
eukprot:TRINITY_DN217_c0_g1_i2.p1 TRINITY_DN217_c0_g1~~TRINITY_DN217_c0_g1_i2.p1  ORF type:complete len:513 (-),score=159.34 TRINITY_DN217_c0_g1_i2:1178-2716(-)